MLLDNIFFNCNFLLALFNAVKLRIIAAVLVPQSAFITSQSINNVFSPI